ncbi:GAF domain-containing sensor histidine kinase [Anaerolineales bacterium HSG6]|nr:GAF domain-containing sensor histidine kinase [Anaerolineales bacterium HSG6]
MNSSGEIQIFQQDDTVTDQFQILTVYDITPELQTLLQHVADDVVKRLGCVGAMVATLESDNSMPVRAYTIDIAPTLFHQLEKRLGATPIGPKSVSYLDDPKFQDNLSVKAVNGSNGTPEIVVSDRLHDLFVPVVNKPLSDIAQKLSGIKQVIAVPFFLEDEVVGNLFAAARKKFSPQDIDFLTAFGRQAAVAIKSQRHLTETQALERVILALQTNITDETQVLQTIVDAVVKRLNYIGAMVATLESDNSLPVRAYSVNIAENLLDFLLGKLGVDKIGSHFAAHLDDDRFKKNLCVQAIKGIDGHPAKSVVSNSLHDLFTPVINRPLSAIAQKMTGIKQVIAVPFSLNDQVVGNLFVATRRQRFSERERDLLATFGQQAAVGIRNARLYRHAEEQRQIAQVFAKMAFSAATNVHALRNHIGGFRTYLSMVKMFPMLSEEHRNDILESTSSIMNNLNESAEILDSLHEPWRKHQDEPTDVNSCLHNAVRKSFTKDALDRKAKKVTTQDGITIYKSLADDLPLIQTSPDMLTEAFRIVIKNAGEALTEHKVGDSLWVESRLNVDMIRVVIRDNGIGISPKNLAKIFEMGWSSKKGKGMGFGLFWTQDYVAGLGGKIRAESREKKGTTFFIDLPLDA